MLDERMDRLDSVLHGRQQQQQHGAGGLIVVASLLDNVPNLAGLCRWVCCASLGLSVRCGCGCSCSNPLCHITPHHTLQPSPPPSLLS